jgi:Fe-S cluster assembly scaffold protein SufB
MAKISIKTTPCLSPMILWTESRQVSKKITQRWCDGFRCKILVKKGAQKTDGYQISQALLLMTTHLAAVF